MLGGDLGRLQECQAQSKALDAALDAEDWGAVSRIRWAAPLPAAPIMLLSHPAGRAPLVSPCRQRLLELRDAMEAAMRAAGLSSKARRWLQVSGTRHIAALHQTSMPQFCQLMMNRVQRCTGDQAVGSVRPYWADRQCPAPRARPAGCSQSAAALPSALLSKQERGVMWQCRRGVVWQSSPCTAGPSGLTGLKAHVWIRGAVHGARVITNKDGIILQQLEHVVNIHGIDLIPPSEHLRVTV
jgi:hypothetical protein